MPPSQQPKKYTKNKFQIRIEELTSDIETLNQTILQHSAMIDSMSVENIDLKDKLVMTQSELSNTLLLNTEITNKYNQTSTELEINSNKYNLLNQEYLQVKSDINNVISSHSTTINNLQDKNAIIEANYIELKDKYLNYNNILKQENQKYIDLKNTLDQTLYELDNLKDLTQVLESEKRQLIEELELVKNKYSTVLKKYEDTISAQDNVILTSSNNNPSGETKRSVFQSKRAVSNKRVI